MKIKKILMSLILSLIFILSLSSIAFGQDDDLEDFAAVFNSIFSTRESFMEGAAFLGAYATGTTQVGIFTTLDAGMFNFGLTTNMVFLDTSAVRVIGGEAASNAIDTIPLLNAAVNYGIIPMGNLYFGVNLPKIPISFYIRGIWIPLATIPTSQGNDPYFADFFLLGGGISFDVGDLFPKSLIDVKGKVVELPHLINLKVTGNYHFSGGIPFLNFHSFGVSALLGFNLAKGIVVPYVGFGWNTSIIGVNVDLWEIYSKWFNPTGTGIPSQSSITDYLNDNRVPWYVKDRIKSNIESYGGVVNIDDNGTPSDTSDDIYTVSDWGSVVGVGEIQDVLTLKDTLTYAANFPLTIGVQFRIDVFCIGIEYAVSLTELFKVFSGNAQALTGTITLTFGFGLGS